MYPGEHASTQAVPVDDRERIASIDIIRAAASLGWVFYGYGLGLFGRLSSAEALPMPPASSALGDLD